MCQGLLLGGGLGVLYDLLRVVRVRGKLRWLRGAADLLFWLAAVWALFRWSLAAWGGQVRLYGAALCLMGGGLYFRLLSPGVLWLGYRLADLIGAILGIFAWPGKQCWQIFKKIGKLRKNLFLSWGKWYRIERKTKEAEQTACRRAARERGVLLDAVQTRRFFDQDRGFGPADLYGHHSAGASGADPDHTGAAGRAGPAGGRSAGKKPGTDRRHPAQG